MIDVDDIIDKYLNEIEFKTPSKDFKIIPDLINEWGYTVRFVTNDKLCLFDAQDDGETWTVRFGPDKKDWHGEPNTTPPLDGDFEINFWSNLKLVFLDFLKKKQPNSFSFSGDTPDLTKLYRSSGCRKFIEKETKYKLVPKESGPNYWRYAK